MNANDLKRKVKMGDLLRAHEALVKEGENHPEPSVLVSFAVNKNSLDKETLSKWENHIDECERCKSTIANLTLNK